MPKSSMSNTKRLTEIGVKIESAQAERHKLATSPRSHAETHEMIDAHIVAMARGAADGVVPPQISIEQFERQGFYPGLYSIINFDSPEQILCSVFPGPFGDFLHTKLDEHLAGKPEGVSTSARAKGLDKLDRQIRTLEIEEEALFCELEREGLDVLRRAVASPEIILAIEPDAEEDPPLAA